jgi:hypothetical protein
VVCAYRRMQLVGGDNGVLLDLEEAFRHESMEVAHYHQRISFASLRYVVNDLL